jgi:DNA-binding FadR family transcriptional regulator
MTISPRNAGEKLADEIEREVASSGMSPGSILASERDLRVAHEAGRSVLRQAVRILEDRGVVKMRRGQGGGLVVQRPGPESAARTLAILIESELVSVADLHDLLKASDNQVFGRALTRLSLDDCRELRALAMHLDSLPSDAFGKAFGHRTLLDAMRRAIPDAGLALAQWTCLECGIDLTPARPHALGERTRSEFWTLSLQGLEAMIAHDIARLFEIRLRQYRIMDDSLREWPIDRQEDPIVPPRGDYAAFSSPKSRADLLTREILRDARTFGWKEGTRLGGAEDLMERYGVSLLVLRQAVRVLEESGAVRMQRGRNGGLFVARPSREIAVGRAVRHLRAAPLAAEDATAFLVELLLACLSLARSRATGALLDRLAATVERTRAPFLADIAETRALCAAIAALARNPALTLFIEVLLELAGPTPPRKPARPTNRSPALVEMHKALVDRDRALARRAFLQHVQDAAAAGSARGAKP